MKLYLDHVGLLEIFVEAQGRVVVHALAPIRAENGGAVDGFTMPKKGKSGLSRGAQPTEAEFKARRAEYARADFKKRMADPAKAERVRELRRERVRRWRAKQKAARP